MKDFEIQFLDHVAIRVKNLEESARWYVRVLGLKRLQPPEWGEFPILLLSGETGIALFPANTNDPPLDSSSKNVKIDHFAFNVTRENLGNAKKHYEELGIEYEFQDHIYYHSIYTRDPDGHQVELTSIIVDKAFY